MDNQQDQFGTPNPTNTGNTGRSGQTPATPGTVSGTSATARKSAPAPSAQSAAPAPDASDSHQDQGQQTNAPEGTLLDTALNSGKKWIEDSGVLNNVNQLPQSLKDLGSRALGKVSGLSTTQKVVGGAILAGGIAWLATRKGKSDSSESNPYNYGRQRDAGSYGRRSYGYQAPDASTGRRPAAGTAGRADSGTPYANSGSRFGSDAGKSSAGVNFNSDRVTEGFGASATTDHGAQASTSRAAGSDFGTSSNE